MQFYNVGEYGGEYSSYLVALRDLLYNYNDNNNNIITSDENILYSINDDNNNMTTIEMSPMTINTNTCTDTSGSGGGSNCSSNGNNNSSLRTIVDVINDNKNNATIANTTKRY